MGKNDYRISVIADDRERKSEVMQFLSEMENVSVGIELIHEYNQLPAMSPGEVNMIPAHIS